MWEAVWWAGIGSVMVAFFATKLVVKFGKVLKIVDDPKSHVHPKVVHTEAVPRGGGMPIYLSLLTGILVWMPKDTKTLGIVGGATILAVWGYLDDRYEEKIPPYIRLILGNVLAALCVVGVGINIPYITNPLGGVIYLGAYWSNILAVVWLVALQNVVGWSSGVDGQLPGFVIVAALTMLLIANRFGLDNSLAPLRILAAITAGAYLGFLPWNWWPQKIMPGYGGKTLAGFLLGVLSILSFGKVGAMMLVLGVPIVDAIVVVLKRLREGRSVFMGGREHMHHYLLDLGWSKRKIAGFYTAMAVIFAIMALTLKAESKLFTMAAVLLILGGTLLWLQNLSISSKRPDRDSG